MKIAKYTALGNHFVVVDELGGEVVEEGHKLAFARFCCDPHFGVGADDVLFIQQASIEMYEIIVWKDGQKTKEYVHQLHNNRKFDAIMRVLEPNGTEASMCGNGVRCVGAYLMEKEDSRRDVQILAEVPTSAPRIKVVSSTARKDCLKVNMGEIVDAPSEFLGNAKMLPQIEADVPIRRLEQYRVDLLDENGVYSNVLLDAIFLYTGEPHLVLFCGEKHHIPACLQSHIEEQDSYYTMFGRHFFAEQDDAVEAAGRLLDSIGRHFNEQDGKYLFPCGVNVNFADVHPENEATQFRVFERGINRETLACGTGATAVAAASHYLDLTGKATHFQVTPTQVSQISEKVGRISNYDSLFVEKAGSEWFLEGPVQKVFEGELPIPEWILDDTTPLSSHG